MTENVRKFLEAVSQNEEEKKEVSALRTKEEVLAYAKGKGFTLTDEDFEQSREELSDDELDVVAGGDVAHCGEKNGMGGSGGTTVKILF